MKQMQRFFTGALLGAVALLSALTPASAVDHLSYEGKASGPGAGKHVVLLAGDEEYRSEECLPMLARILSEHHGFKTTVCFSLNEQGEIDPTAGASLTQPEALDSADAIVILLRFRHWQEATVKRFEAAINRGIPIIALRTSTHAFNFPKDHPYASWTWNHPEGGWGKKVLGETWVTHWGKHKKEATLGVIEPGAASHPILSSVTEVFGDSDVYEAAPPADATILMRGTVLEGMTKDTPPASYRKPTKGGVEQAVNQPMMPIAWVRQVPNAGGTTNPVFCTTMGAATDLLNEGLRRMVVNAVFWGLKLDVPASAEVTPTGTYEPSMYGFGDFQKGLKPVQ